MTRGTAPEARRGRPAWRVATLALVVATAAAAHDTWMIPERFACAAGEEVTLVEARFDGAPLAGLSLGVLAGAGLLGAQETAAAGDAAATVASFHRALAAGDREAALALLDPEVVVFEQGGAELSRDEYAASHLGADIEFSASTERRVLDQRAGGAGDVAWVLTRSETAGTFRGSGARSAGVETMVLEKRDGAWRIVHIHWSGRSLD